MKGNEDRKETDAALAIAASGIVTGISALPFYEIFAKEGSLLGHLQTISSAFLSGNIHGGSLMAGTVINFFAYALIFYGALRWGRRRRGLQVRGNG